MLWLWVLRSGGGERTRDGIIQDYTLTVSIEHLLHGELQVSESFLEAALFHGLRVDAVAHQVTDAANRGLATR